MKTLLSKIKEVYQQIVSNDDKYYLNKRKCIDYLRDNYTVDINPQLSSVYRITLLFIGTKVHVSMDGNVKYTPIIVGKFSMLKGGLTYYGCWNLNGKFIKLLTDDPIMPSMNMYSVIDYFASTLDIERYELLSIKKLDEVEFTDTDTKCIEDLLTNVNSLHDSIHSSRFISIGLINTYDDEQLKDSI